MRAAGCSSPAPVPDLLISAKYENTAFRVSSTFQLKQIRQETEWLNVYVFLDVKKHCFRLSAF